MTPKIDVITLGVKDVDRAREFVARTLGARGGRHRVPDVHLLRQTARNRALANPAGSAEDDEKAGMIGSLCHYLWRGHLALPFAA